MTHSTKTLQKSNEPLIEVLTQILARAKRPSSASVTTILPLNDLLLWRSKWLVGHTISDDEFRPLKPTNVVSIRDGLIHFHHPTTASEWANATSLNPKTISHPRTNYRVYRIKDLFTDSFIRVVKRKTSSSVSFYITRSDLPYIHKLLFVLSGLHQHVLVGVVD